MNNYFKEKFDTIFTKNKNSISVLNELLQKTNNKICFDYKDLNKVSASIEINDYNFKIYKENFDSNLKQAKLKICLEMIAELIGDREYALNKLEKDR